MQKMVIGKSIEIVKIGTTKGLRFNSGVSKGGLGLYVYDRGWLSYDELSPYIPIGGRKALKEIIKQGISSFEGLKFVTPIFI